MVDEAALRKQLSRLLEWQDAHVGFDKAVAGIPAELRGKQPEGLPYSLWQLVDHIRRTQFDILDFCRNPDYQQPKWPDEYWPPTADPPTPEAWDDTVRQYKEDRKALQQLASDSSVELNARVPQGNGQTFLRELVLVADHTAYHVGQVILVRRLLGIW